MAARIVEKYRAWSDCDGDVERAVRRDELCANLTVYWATKTIGSSMRLYYENTHPPAGGGQSTRSWAPPCSQPTCSPPRAVGSNATD
ncbi:MAG: hypothetical protein ACR2HP_14060, partial [Ilumatobacteraceae bacterium]